MEIRRLGGSDAELYREIRLRSLAEAPYAFCSTFEEERAFDAAVWTARVTNPEAATFVAEEDGRSLGTVAVIPAGRRATAQLVAMWVAPESRGTGAATRLIETAAGWARDRGVRRLELSVIEGNDPARARYEKCGFAATGERRPLPSNPAIAETRFARDL